MSTQEQSTSGTDSEGLVLTTGADAYHYANLKVLLGSWLANMGSFRIAICDYGLSPEQRADLALFPKLSILPAPQPISHPWLGKALLGAFLRAYDRPWQALLWLDADALFASPLPPVAPLLEGYDMLLDAHVQSIGEIAHDCNRTALQLKPDDAYYAAGWWVARRGCLLENYERFTRLVMGKGNLWEGDAFVAAIYAEKLHIRNVCGSIWHARGKTSLHTCSVEGLTPLHAGFPIYVLHANDGYEQLPTGRRVFKRPELARIQAHYEQLFDSALARLRSKESL